MKNKTLVQEVLTIETMTDSIIQGYIENGMEPIAAIKTVMGLGVRS